MGEETGFHVTTKAHQVMPKVGCNVGGNYDSSAWRRAANARERFSGGGFRDADRGARTGRGPEGPDGRERTDGDRTHTHGQGIAQS